MPGDFPPPPSFDDFPTPPSFDDSQSPQSFDEPTEPDPPPAAVPPRGCLRGCLGGCLIGVVISICVCVGITFWVVRNFVPLAADTVRAALVSGVNQSQLDAAEKLAVIAEIDRVVEQFKDGQIDSVGLRRIFEELSQSPLMGTLILVGIEKKYLDQSGLNGDERAAARQTLQRLLRGIYQHQIDLRDLRPALAPICTTDPNGEEKLKERITDEELRTFLDACRATVDQAGVPDEPFTIKLSDEFRKAIDRALGPRPQDLPPGLPEKNRIGP